MSINYKQTFGTNLKQARQAAGLSLKKFATLVGKSDTYLRQVESGFVSVPTEETIRKIAEVLSLDADQVVLSSGRIPQYIVDGLLANKPLFDKTRSEVLNYQEF